MPAPDSTFIRTASRTMIRFALEPAHNIIQSMMILNKINRLSGYSQWIVDTAASLTPEQAHNNLLVLEGLHYAVQPQQSWSSFPAYIDYLAQKEPTELRDAILTKYINLPCKIENEPSPFSHPTDMLATLGTFIDYLQSRFNDSHINIALETEAYALLKDPPNMQQLIISHLREMWLDFFAAEWDNNVPMLQTSVNAFQQLDLQALSPLEAAQRVIGQPVPPKWHQMLDTAELDRIVFVPSVHLGPYWGIFKDGREAYLLYGARLPEGATISSPELNRSELLMRIGAMADDTRLHILHILSGTGELCSKDIMMELGLSQSATSRHLKQLTATGYLDEKWRDGAKCYSLSETRIKSTLSAIEQFLLG